MGDGFELWVSPTDAGDAVVNSFGDRYVEVFAFGLISLLLFLVGYKMLQSP